MRTAKTKLSRNGVSPWMLATFVAVAVGSPATAQTLTAGNNDPVQIHADPNRDQTNTTVYGLTQTGNVSVFFTSDTMLETNGNGYAIIEDNTPNDIYTFDNVLVGLEEGGGFSEYEFSVEFGKLPKDFTAELTVNYTFVGGGGGSFTSTTAGCAICSELSFTNAGLKDFRLFSGAGNLFSTVSLTSNFAIDKLKHNDIVVSNVPEASTWAMMLFGFGGVGVAVRRRRTRQLKTLLA